MDFASTIPSKDHIKPVIESAGGVKAEHIDFHNALDDSWVQKVPLIEALPVSQNVFTTQWDQTRDTGATGIFACAPIIAPLPPRMPPSGRFTV
jgi:hypothetical protein